MRTLVFGAGVGPFLFRILTAAFAVLPTLARASLLPPELEDAVAEAMSWIVLVVVPIVAIAVFWLVHILPEKIAERRKHPQAKAIQTLCLLSLFFGGMLWPLAWLWAYSKPVMYKLAYGTDVVEPEHGPPPAPPKASEPKPVVASEMRLLEQKIAELEAQIAQEEALRGGQR
jgi:CBS domain containing-hemolysin-like protein